MFKNYLSIVIRSIWKHKVFSAINILGLAIGISCSLLILIYVQYEFSFDRYHENLDRIYRISLHGSIGGNDINATTSPYPMAAAVANEFPEVESTVRLQQFFSEALVSLDDVRYRETEVFYTDQSFFDIFTVQFLAGDPSTALVEPNSIVITEAIADKYFPDVEAVGKALRFNNDRDFQVTAVVEDIPDNSHFHPDILVSLTSNSNHDSQFWINNNIQTYLMLRPGISPEQVNAKLQDLVIKYAAPQLEEGLGVSYQQFVDSGGSYGYQVFPLRDIHLYSQLEGEIEPPGSAAYVYTFQAIAVFILLLACINFMNLSTARSTNRAKEIGVRKVVGAYRTQLVGQFLIESTIITGLALIIALPMVALLLPAFGAITERELSMAILLNPLALALLVVFAVVVGTLSGSYPALFLSRFQPQSVLKGQFVSGTNGLRLRGVLVVFQFVISIALVAATLIVFNQLDYLRNKPLGFQKEQVIVIHRAGALGDQLESFRNVIKQNPNVINASSSSHIPGAQYDQNAFMIDGRPAQETYILARLTVNFDFIETLGIEVIEGRSFEEISGADHNGFIVNETAVNHLNLTNPLQTRLMEPDTDTMVVAPIIGVVRDLHFDSLHQEIRPMVLRIDDFTRFVVVRVRPENMQQTIAALENQWSTMTLGEPFEYTFLDEDFDSLHQGDQRVGQLFFGFSVLAILIACLGLYGLASYTTAQRTKEIGIRKTMGASVSSIVLLISRDFMLLVITALVVAIPITWFAMNEWLQLFAYRDSINPTVFLTSGVLALLIAFATVSIQSAKAALTNPSLTLRDE